MTVAASRRAPIAKLDRIRALGAELELMDGDIEIARQRAASIVQQRGIRLLEDSLDIETCEGAATIGLEIASARSTVDAVPGRESSIITGMRLVFEHAGLVIEPSAALGVAAVLENRQLFAGRHVITIICGSNVDPDGYRRWIHP